MEETIFLKGRILNSKVPSILDSFAIFCATSIQERFGVSIIEAMAMELPVVTTAVPGFKEIVDNNITGLIVDNMNSLEIAKALKKLVSNEQLRIDMEKNGRIKAKEQYDWNHNVDKMIVLYNIVAVKG